MRNLCRRRLGAPHLQALARHRIQPWIRLPVRIGVAAALRVALAGFAGVVTCAVAPAQQNGNPNVARSLDVQPLEPTEYHSMNYRRLLFATDRKVVLDAESQARDKIGGFIQYENIFTSALDPSMAYGWVDVEYPSERELGAQTYSPKVGDQNPLKYFSIVGYGTVGSREEARNLAIKSHLRVSDRALVYVHGINNSFRDAAERLTQLVIDLKITGIPLLFSWPGENAAVPVVGISGDSYRTTLAIARKSEPYASQAIDDVISFEAVPFDLLAHSMGTLVAFDMLKDRPVRGIIKALDRANPPQALPNVVFAAPDIGMKYFVAGREEVVRKIRSLTIYCSKDRALQASSVLNNEDRVGYCAAAKRQKDYMDGVEFVRVFGESKDAANHSYYINTPAVLGDIGHALSTPDSPSPPDDFTSAIRRPYREIFLKE
jgi:esterase/lipase superfamily enzyme